MQQGKAKCLADAMDHLVAWQETILHRIRNLGRAAFEDDMMRSALLNMLPAKEEKELRNQRVLFAIYEALSGTACARLPMSARGAEPQ